VTDERSHPWLPLTPGGAAYFYATQFAAAAAVVASAVSEPVAWSDAGRALLLTAIALLHAEAARNVERIRRRDDSVAHIDLNSTWTVAAALALPLELAAAVIVVIYVHVSLRVRRMPLYRRAFNVAMYILAAGAARVVFDINGPGTVAERLEGGPGALAVLGALVAYTALNILILTGWLRLAMKTEHPLRTALGTTQDNALEVATLCLGVFIAMSLDQYPLLVIVGVPLILVLHRNILIRQLEEDARTDTKTGLLNATAWADTARDEISRAQRREDSVGVLVLDLDLFKRVNDTYGHLAGDEVLLQFAATLRTEVRTSDYVGRFGGEEFVVLLPDISVEQMVVIAERIRRRMESLTVIATNGSSPQIIDDLSVSIGAAAFPLHGMDLDQLMDAADKALYKAKDNGRNQTQVAPPLEPGAGSL
jgi:diguanylate cyclase (GGDEF)-like protein